MNTSMTDEQAKALATRVVKALINAADGDRTYINLRGDSIYVDAGFNARDLAETFAKEFGIAP